MRQVLVSSPKQQGIGQEEMASSCVKGGLDWILGKISFLKEWSDIGTGWPENTILGGVKKMCRCGTLGYGLVGMVVMR